MDPHPVLRRLYGVCRSIVGGLFVLAGILKLVNLRAFAQTVGDFGIVPEGFELPVAAPVASLEVVSGTALALDVRGALGMVAALLVLFAGVLWYGVALELDVECGCFGPVSFLELRDLRGALARSLALLGACGYLYVSRFALRLRPASAGEKLHRVLSRNQRKT